MDPFATLAGGGGAILCDGVMLDFRRRNRKGTTLDVEWAEIDPTSRKGRVQNLLGCDICSTPKDISREISIQNVKKSFAYATV